MARDAANTVLSLVGRTVIWSSSATNVATVNGSGLVTALAAGTTTIGVTVDGVGPATYVLTVIAAFRHHRQHHRSRLQRHRR